MTCFFAAHEETIVFLLVDVLTKPVALLPAKWERSWSPTRSKGNSGINLNNRRKNLDSAVLTDNIHPCCYKTLATPEGWETISVCLPISHPFLHIALQARDDFISEIIHPLASKELQWALRSIHTTLTSQLPWGFAEVKIELIVAIPGGYRRVVIQNNSNMKATGFRRHSPAIYFSS